MVDEAFWNVTANLHGAIGIDVHRTILAIRDLLIVDQAWVVIGREVTAIAGIGVYFDEIRHRTRQHLSRLQCSDMTH